MTPLIKKMIAFILLLAACNNMAEAQQWRLKKEDGNLKLYTATEENSSFKSVRAEDIVRGRLSQVVAAINDLDRQKEWVYKDKYSRLLKQVSDNEFIYYSEVNVPWPATNRDFIARV